MGTKGATTTSTSGPPQQFLDAYTEALGMARNAANTPYQAYGGQMVAGLTPTQQAGIQNINNAQGMALPFLNQAAGLVGNSAGPIAAQKFNAHQVNKYMSPYLSNVVDATQQNLLEQNAQQQQALNSGAMQAGAFGGDRSGIAQAELARQQNLANGATISGLLNQGYGQALGEFNQQQGVNLSAAQADAARQQQAAQLLSGIGTTAQNSVLQGAQAQMAGGAQEQATQQAQLQAAYNQWLQQQAYPFQTAQFFGNIAEGIGAGAGGTSTTTSPQGNWISEILGGLGAIGSIFKDGGRVERADGGLVSDRMAFADGGSGGSVGDMPYLDLDVGPFSITRVPAKSVKFRSPNLPDYPRPYDNPGLSDAWNKINAMPGFEQKGLHNIGDWISNTVSPSVYADGGAVDPVMGDGGSGLAPDVQPSIFPVVAKKILGYEGGYLPKDANGTPTNFGINQAAHPEVDVSKLTPDSAVQIYKAGYWDKINGDKLPPKLATVAMDTAIIAGPGKANQILAASGGDPEKFMDMRDRFLGHLVNSQPDKYGPFAKAWANRSADLRATVLGQDSGHPLPANDTPSPGLGDVSRETGKPPAHNLIEGLTGMRMSPEARAGLLAASLGMMASKSPFALQAIGEGGLAGVNTYYNAIANQRALQKQQADIGLTQAETGKTEQEVAASKQNMTLAVYQAWMNINASRAYAGLPPISADEFKQQFLSGGAQPAVAPPGPVSAPSPIGDTDNGPIEQKPLPQPAKPADTTAEAPQAPAAPSIDKGIGPDGQPKPGTLAFWTQQMDRAKNAAAYSAGDPAKLAAAQTQIANANEQIRKITESPFYEGAQKFAEEYPKQRDALIHLAEINASYQGGRGSEAIADIVGVMQTLGLGDAIPDSMRNDPAKYDEAMKLALTQAISQAQDSGLLRAPGQTLKVEQKITPDPNLAPGARYDLIRRAIANMDWTNGMYKGWDTSPDTARYTREYADSHPYQAFYDAVGKELAQPKLPPQSTKTWTDDQYIRTLNDKLPNAAVGTRKYANGKTFVKTDSGWTVDNGG